MPAANNMSTPGNLPTAAIGSDDVAAEEGAQPALGHKQLLDPLTSERRYWRDPLSGTQREIWRPGMLQIAAVSCIH